MNDSSRGTPIALPEGVLIPVSRALRVTLPGALGGLVWNRPFGVEIEERGLSRFVRVPDRTRTIQIGLLAAGLAAGALLRLVRTRRWKRRRIFGGRR